MLRFTGITISERFVPLNLCSLTFEFQNLGSQAVAVCQAIGVVGKARVVNLASNKITDAEVPGIIEHLLSNSKMSLEQLDLGDNDITEVGAQWLLTAFEQSSTLKALFLRGNVGICSSTLEAADTIQALREGTERPLAEPTELSMRLVDKVTIF